MSFVGDIFDAVGDAIEWVGDAISDVVEFIADDILKPVADFVGDFIEGLAADPLTTIAKGVALFTGNAWAIPIIEGASVAAKGGDFGDVLKAVAISYATQTIGAELGDIAGDFASEALGDVAGEVIAEETIARIAGEATKSSFNALLYGTDPLEAFITGGLGAAINSATSAVAEELGFNFTSEERDANGKVIRNADGSIKVKTDPIPNIVLKLVKAGVTAKLQGKEITGALLAGAVAEGVLTTELVQGVGSDLGIDFAKGSNELTFLTAGLQRVAAVAASGGTGEQAAKALLSTLDAYGMAELTKTIRESDIGVTIGNTIDKISGDYQKTEKLAGELDDIADRYETNREEYETKRIELNNIVTDINKRKAELDNIGSFGGTKSGDKIVFDSEANQKRYNAKVAEYNAAVANFNNKYSTYTPRMDALKKSLIADEALYKSKTEDFRNAQLDLQSGIQKLDDGIKPLTEDLIIDTVGVMDPSFDVKAYKQINNLSEETNGYEHFLANSSAPGIYTNYSDYEAAIQKNAISLVEESFRRANVDPTTLDQEFVKDLISKAKNSLRNNADAGTVSVLSNDTVRDFYTEAVAEGIVTKYADEASPYKDAVMDLELDTRLRVLGFDMTGVEEGTPLTSYQKAALISEDRRNNGDTPNSIRIEAFSAVEDLVNGGSTITIDRNGYVRLNTVGDTGEDKQPEFEYIYDPTFGRVVKEIKIITDDAGNALEQITLKREGTGEIVFQSTDLAPPLSVDQKVEVLSLLGTESTMSGEEINRFIQAAEKMGFSKEKAATMFGVMSAIGGDAGTNFVANAVKAGGGILEAASGLTTLFGIAPSDTALGKFARDLTNLGKATNTSEYKEELKNLQTKMSANGSTYDKAYKAAKAAGKTDEQARTAAIQAQNALPWYDRALEKVTTIAGAISEHPTMFIAEYIGVEAVQELVPLAVGGLATLGAKGALALAGKTLSTRIAARTGITAAAATDLAESFGATASDAYDRGYETAIKSGMDPEAAKEYALDLAVKSGTIAATITAVSFVAPGMDGLALEKAILNKDNVSGLLASGIDAVGKRIAEGAVITVKEGVTEAIEEGAASLYTAAHLKQIDPTIDVAGEAAAGAFMGFLIGGPVSGGAYGVSQTGDIVSNATIALNSGVQALIENTPNTKAGIVAATVALNGMGITGDTQANILNEISNENYVSTAEAIDMATNAGFNEGYTFTSEKINRLVGAADGSNTYEAVQNYADVRAVTAQEVIDRAAAEGVTITEEQAQEFVGEGTGKFFEKNTMKVVGAKYDPLAATDEEVQQRFNKLGYTPTTEERRQFTKEGNETEILDSIDPYVDPRQVTYDEAKKYLTDLNFNPTEEQIKSFIGQGDANFQTSTGANIATYVDARQVTEAEARKFFSDLGFRPTKEQVAQFVGQGGANFQTLTGENISAYVNPRQVTYAEAKKYFTDLGFEPSQEQIDQFIGQGGDNFQTETGTRISAYVNPRQVTEAEARKFFTDLGFEPSEEQINQFIGQGDDTFEASIKEKVAPYIDPRQITYDEARQILIDNGVSNPTPEQITQFVGQGDADFQTTSTTNIANYADPLVVTAEEVKEAYAEQGLDRPLEGDVTKLVGEYDESTLGTKVEENLDTARFNLTSADIAEVKDIIGAPAGTRPLTIDDATEILKVAIGIENRWGLTGGESDPDIIAALDLNKDGIVDVNDALIVAGIAEGQITGEEAEAFISGSILEQDLQTPATGLFKTIADNEAAGIARDEAISNAVDTVASDLNTTREDLLNRIGVTEDTLIDTINTSEETLRGEITDVKTTLGEQITGVESALGEQITGVETALGEQITGVETALSEDISGISELLGKPAQEVTQEDYDFVTDAIASNIVLNEQQVSQYDVNGDGVVDNTDAEMLARARSGELVAFAPTSVYSPTGVYKSIFDTRLDQQTQNQAVLDSITQTKSDIQSQLDTQQEQTTDLVTKTATDIKDFITGSQSAERGRRLLSDMLSGPGYSVETKQVDPLKLDYIYDFSSIFANPQQESLFTSPYRKGGQVNDITDKLLQIIGGSK